MPLTISWTAHSEVGLVRKNNQDSAYASPTMAMVADGMGGAAAGDLASAVAIDELRRTDEGLAERLASGSVEPSDVLTVLAGALQRANDTLTDLVDSDPALDGMGTTVCGFVVVGDALALTNIGDSRAYRLRDGHFERLTHDHSWVQSLVDEGRISEEEALEHPHRSLVLRVLNGSPAHEPDLEVVDLAVGDRLLVCTDGLCGLVTDAQIAEQVARPDRETAVTALVALAPAAGGHDNITLILVDVGTDSPAGQTQVLGAAATTRVPQPEHTAKLPVIEGASEKAAAPRPFTESDRYAPSGRRGIASVFKVGLAVLVPLLVLAGGGWGWYSYTQTRLYVGQDDDVVAIFRGVPDRVPLLTLSHVLERDTTRVSDLPPYYAERVRATIPVDTMATARETVGELRLKAAQCIAQREARARATAEPDPPATPDPTDPATPGPGGTATPDDAPTTPGGPPPTPGTDSPTATPGVTPTPVASQAPVLSPEEC